ncbi:MAG TPA: hypothetical protein VGK90_00390 [Rhizomicrobium sp.]|jgi:hypothetical protein
MGKRFIFGVMFSLAVMSQVANGEPSQPIERVAFPATAVSMAHPVRAVLRYDLSSAGSCRAFSNQPVELCLLLALHVIHMSEKQPKSL